MLDLSELTQQRQYTAVPIQLFRKCREVILSGQNRIQIIGVARCVKETVIGIHMRDDMMVCQKLFIGIKSALKITVKSRIIHLLVK